MSMAGLHLSEEHKRKLSEANRGKKASEESKKRMSEAQRNKTDDHKRKIGEAHKGMKHTDEARKKISEGHKGKKLSEEHKKKIGEAHKGQEFTKERRERIAKALMGKTLTLEHRKNLSEAKRRSAGWKGGITPISKAVRFSVECKIWKKLCFDRDFYTCQKCGYHGKGLVVHHKYPFYKLLEEAIQKYPLLNPLEAAKSYDPLWDEDNGVTLCGDCHGKETIKIWRAV